MGKTELLEGCPMNQIHDTVKKKDRQIPDMEPENRIENSTDGISHGNVYGTYIHGIFDKEKIVSEIVKSLAEKKRTFNGRSGRCGPESIQRKPV